MPNKFDLERAINIARDYAVSTGMECFVLPADQSTIINPCEGMIHNYLCYGFNSDVAKMCINLHAEGAYLAKNAGSPQSYYCPMGLLHWASPVIVDGRIEAAFIAGHAFLNQSQEEILSFKNISGKHEKLLASYPKLKRSLLESPVINDERLQSLKNMLDVIARSFTDGVISEDDFHDIREAFRKSYTCDPIYTEDISWNTLLTAIRDNDNAAARKALDKVLKEIRQTADPQPVRVALTQLILFIYDHSLEKEGQDFLSERCLNALNELERIDNIEELAVWTENSLKAMFEASALIPSLKNADMLFKAVQYIQDHYKEKFSLQDIANYVHFSAPYFSKIFKKEIGVTFTKYLTNVRIEKSKQLLKNTGVALSDIPALVGFEEQSYFTRVFRSTTGISPGKYRARNTQ
ncbi:MAG TPA: helix-turn-helix domain-containing protein [Clostridiales bacterium]|nr:helix-turn-helix domain-containing protein [Clostridiales bacterium]